MRARQNAEKGVSRTYVATLPHSPSVVGYYTIRAGDIAFDLLPLKASRGIPRYPVPSIHIARLAVDKRQQGQGLGEILLMDALKLAKKLSDLVGVFVVTVDALNSRAAQFYMHFDFERLLDDELHLFLPVGTIQMSLT
ncbi:MAG: GNAT family N-acetyltransferase [Phycisphaerae bacterium]